MEYVHVYKEGDLKYETKPVRDVFDGTTFKCQEYIKTRDVWKDTMRCTSKEWLYVTATKRKEIPLYEGTHVAYKLDGNIALQKFFEYMEKEVPAFKYWRAKLESLDAPNLGILAKLVEYQDIPETESLIILRELIQDRSPHNIYDFPGIQVLDKAWRKVSKGERKEYINGMRDKCHNVYSSLLSRIMWRLEPPSMSGVRGAIKKCHPERCLDLIAISAGWGRERNLGVTVRDVQWLIRTTGLTDPIDITSIAYEFRDYLYEICEEATDIMDPYWRHRRDWNEVHRRNMEAREREERERAVIEHRQEQLAELERPKKLKEKYQQYEGMELIEGNLRAYISGDFEIWKKQAKALRQCIVSCNYDKVDDVLVFIERNGKPDSTAQITTGNKIVQFYADERSVLTQKPSKEAKALMDKFLAKYKIK